MSDVAPTTAAAFVIGMPCSGVWAGLCSETCETHSSCLISCTAAVVSCWFVTVALRVRPNACHFQAGQVVLLQQLQKSFKALSKIELGPPSYMLL